MSTIRYDDMSVAMADGPMELRTADAGEMAVSRSTIPAGTDFAPVLKAISPRGCMVPHWIYVTSGELRMRYDDGRVDVARAGEVLYAEPGTFLGCRSTPNSSRYRQPRKLTTCSKGSRQQPLPGPDRVVHLDDATSHSSA